MDVNDKKWKLEALTPIWTGDVNRSGDRLIPTGIIGSLRWWFEVLVRGLGGKACDPTAEKGRCPAKNGKHCVVCELFGCTGWSRKFRLMILDENGEVIQKQMDKGDEFTLRFIPLRPIEDEEWCLIGLTLHLIAGYGAIGGKIVFKPSEEWGIADLGPDDLDDSNGRIVVQRSRRGLKLQRNDIILEIDGNPVNTIDELKNLLSEKPHGEPLIIRIERNGTQEQVKAWAGKRHHQDLGLIRIIESPQGIACTREQIEAYVQGDRWRKDIDDSDFAWASLKNYWYVEGRHLSRQSFTQSTYNRVLGRNMRKDQAQNLWRDTPVNKWLAGRQQMSKKIFSFKNPARTFGFVKPGLVDFDEIKRRLGRVWQDFNPDNEFRDGEWILNELFNNQEASE